MPDSAQFYAQGAGESLCYFGDNHVDVAMRLAQERFPEKVQYPNATLEANGDNEGGQFSYSSRQYDFDFSHSGFYAVRHGRRVAPEAPQRSEDINSIMASAIIISGTARPVFHSSVPMDG